MNTLKTYYIIIPFLIESVFACATCYGDPNSSAGKEWIWLLLPYLELLVPFHCYFHRNSFNWTEIKKINHNLTEK